MIRVARKKLGAVFVVLAGMYIAESVIFGVDKATLHRYDLSQFHATLLALTVTVPYVVVWFIAFLGYDGLHQYADKIKGEKDGLAWSTVCKGLFFLMLWLPLSTIVRALVKHLYMIHPQFTIPLVVIDNYINLSLLIPGFIYTYKGARQLVLLIKKPALEMSLLVSFVYIAGAAFYVLLTLHDPARSVPTSIVRVSTYFEPDWLIVLSIVIPRLIMWYLGILAVQLIYRYRLRVKGSIYRAALSQLSFGIAGLVLFTIILRSFQSLTEQLDRLGLRTFLLVIYLLLTLIGVSSYYIFLGSSKLQRIEAI